MIIDDGPPLISPLEGYINGEIATKSKLYQHITDYKYDYSILQFHKIMSEVSDQDIMDGIQALKDRIIEPTLSLINTTPGLITQDYINNNLTLLNYIEEHYGRTETIRTKLDTLTNEAVPQASSIQILLDETMAVYQKELLDLIGYQTDLQWNFTQSMNTIKRKMEPFEDLGSDVLDM